MRNLRPVYASHPTGQGLITLLSSESSCYEVSFLRKDGSSFPVVVSPAITQGTEHQAGAYFATIRDVSEQKQIQAERIQSQRLRVIGELSAGVSHNLNNILTSILGPAQLLEIKTRDPNLLKDIETIQVSATRAADLVKKLSWTTADRRQELGPVDLKMSIEQAIDASSPKWRDEVQARGSRRVFELARDARLLEPLGHCPPTPCRRLYAAVR